MLKVLCSPCPSLTIFVDVLYKPGSNFPKETQQKAFCCIISKGLKFWREGILFSSGLHNEAFREPLLKGIATAFVLKGVSFGRVCWCRQTGWWLTKVIRLWNLASSIRWYVFCVWKDNSQETKAFWRSPPPRIPLNPSVEQDLVQGGPDLTSALLGLTKQPINHGIKEPLEILVNDIWGGERCCFSERNENSYFFVERRRA